MTAKTARREHDGASVLDQAYTGWRAAQGECAQALHRWLQASGADRSTSWCCYVAALDREEAAARDLQRLHESS